MAPDDVECRSVLIADKNPVLAAVLAEHLQRRPALKCDSVDAQSQLTSAVVALAPDVLIVDPADLDLSTEHDLLDFGRDMRIASPTTRLLGYSFSATPATIRAALAAGFRGCVSKQATLSQLETAIEAVLEDGVYFDTRFASQLRPMLAEGGKSDDHVLSDREKEILVCVARGMSAKQIANNLKISSKTVDTYKSRACQKLDLNSRATLVDYVLEQGWIS